MKAKGWFVSTLIMSMAGGIIYCLWNYAIRSYYVVIQWVALYGFVMAWVNLAKWLGKAPTETPAGWIPTWQDADWSADE